MNKSQLKPFFELLTQPLNIPQSMVVPPYVYDAIYNTSTSWLLGKIAELFPKDQTLVDIAEPFLVSEIKQVRGGIIDLPAEYRNFLGAGALVQSDYSGACCDSEGTNEISKRAYELGLKRGGCIRQAVRIVDISEWDYLTKDSFDYPTLEQPIACFFGKKQLKICPASIINVEIRYLINENMYHYGYIVQPDDTFIFNEKTSTESQWTNAAFDNLYKCATKLIWLYLRDNNIASFSSALTDVEFK